MGLHPNVRPYFESARRYHDLAMDVAHRADDCKMFGDIGSSRVLLQTAARLETLAATEIHYARVREGPQEVQPTYSILLRSAAWLHVNAGNFDKARAILRHGLPIAEQECRHEYGQFLELEKALKSPDSRTVS